MAITMRKKLVRLMKKKDNPKEKVINSEAKNDAPPIPTIFKASTRFASLSISWSFSRSIILLMIAEPPAERTNDKIVSITKFGSGKDLEASIIPVNPVSPTLRIIVGLQSKSNAAKYFMRSMISYSQKLYLIVPSE